MLSECIIGEKYLFLRAPGYHIIRPVEHRCGDKGEAAFSETQSIVVLYGHIIVRAVVGGEPFTPLGALVTTVAFGQASIKAGRAPE